MIWVNYNDLTATEPWEYVFLGKSSPFMAELFRLVKYYNLRRSMYAPYSKLTQTVAVIGVVRLVSTLKIG